MIQQTGFILGLETPGNKKTNCSQELLSESSSSAFETLCGELFQHIVTLME